MKRFHSIVLLTVLLAGCQAYRLARAPLGGMPDRPPKISGLIDLGSAAVPVDGPLDQAESDGRFIGGEWVAITGAGLNTDRTRLLLDGREIDVRDGLEGGGLLFRLPGDLRFRHRYAVRVETPLGSAETGFTASNLLVLSDARAGRLLFWRTASEGKLPFERDLFPLDCAATGPFSRSPAGGLLYATARGDAPRQPGLHSFELKALHLGARKGPQEISSAAFEARSAPVSLVVAPDGAHAFAITADELIVFDLTDRIRPRFLSRQDLPSSSEGKKTAYRDLVLLSGGSMAAVLDEPNNRIVLIDLSRPEAPTVRESYAQPAGGPHAVGLLADAADPDLLWVLTGLNAHQVRLRVTALWSDGEPDVTPTRASLIRMDLKGGRLIPREPLDLPEGALPLGMFPEKNGDLLVSAVAYEKETLAKADLSLKGAVSFAKGVRDSIFAGRIYRVAGDGAVTNEVKSVNFLLSMSRIEDSPLAYSTYRISMNFLFPSVDVVLTVDLLKRQSLPVRELNWKTILPPYTFFPEIALI